MFKTYGVGRLAVEPEVRTSKDKGLSMVTFSVATSRKGDKDKADFFRAIAFGKTAEFIQKYFHKGDPIIIHGRLESNTFEGKDGQKVTKEQIVIDDVEFTPRPKQDQQTSNPAPAPKQASFTESDDFDDDIPF